MTRAQMRRAAMAVADDSSPFFGWLDRANRYGVPVGEIDETNPRFLWWMTHVQNGFFSVSWSIEASLLMSEAAAPKRWVEAIDRRMSGCVKWRRAKERGK